MNTVVCGVAIPCPWCKRGETLTDDNSIGHISTRCHVCNRVHYIDLEKKRAYKAAPIPKTRSPAQCKVT